MNRDFKGIWIPKKIWLIPDLKPTYRVFLAEIDSLDNGVGCYAENSHFSGLFGLSKNRCSEIVSMLEKEGYISVEHDVRIKGELRRKIKVLHPFGKSTDPSTFRQTPSTFRQTPSENRLAIYKVLDIQLDIQERDIRALDFLFLNFENRFTEQFLMPYWSKIKDKKKFWADFNDTADDEKRMYDEGLFFRLGKFTRNWISNQDKYSQKEEIAPVASKKTLRYD